MKKVINLMLVLSMTSTAWEINTHRAIEREAIRYSQNLETFVKNSGIKNENYKNEKFEGYSKSYYAGDYSYIDYVLNGEENGISNDKWNQTFYIYNIDYQDLIEAGSILEDAQWQHFLDGGQYNYYDMTDGRFVNHFYDAQNGGHALTYGAYLRTDALHWALGSRIYAGNYGGYSTYVNSPNIYTYSKAIDYFLKGFTEVSPSERKKYQAKMLVGVGHLLHLMNDMTSTAHTRDDSHPEGDVMEKWGRGGESGGSATGFRISGNTLLTYANISTYPDNHVPKYSRFSDFITREAYWTATHFFSNDTIFTKPKPSVSDTYESFASSRNGVDKYYIVADGYHDIPNGKKLAIRIKSYIINALGEKYYTGSSENLLLDKSTSFQGDFAVLKDNAKILIPRAIANARNFLNYFFRGQISAYINGSNITIKNISNPSLVKDRNTVIISPGKFHIKYTTQYNQTLRDFTFERDMSRYEPNIVDIGSYHVYAGGFTSRVSLAPGESLVVAIKKDTSIMYKDIVVIYDGIIGNERAISVCEATTPSVMSD